MDAKILAQTIKDEILLIRQALIDDGFTILEGTPFDDYYLVLDDTIDKESIQEEILTEYEEIISNLPLIVQETVLCCLIGKECMKQAILSYYEHDLSAVEFVHYHEFIKTDEIIPRYISLSSNVSSEFWGKPVTLTANCTNVPNGETVTFYNNSGAVINTAKVSNGKAVLTTNLPNTVGTYNFKATWSGTVEDTPYSSTSNVKVSTKKHNVSIVRNHSTTLYKEHYVRYTLKDSTLNKILSSKTLVCKVAGNSYNITTNSSGYAQRQLTGSTDGTYSESCSFNGDSLYNTASLASRNFTYNTYKQNNLYYATQYDSLDSGGCGATTGGKYYGRWYNHGHSAIDYESDPDTHYAYVPVASSGGTASCQTPSNWYIKTTGYQNDGSTKYPIQKIIKFGCKVRHRHYNSSGAYPLYKAPKLVLQFYNGSEWINKETKTINDTTSSFKTTDVLFSSVPSASEVTGGKVRTYLSYPRNSKSNPGYIHVSSYYHYIRYIPTQTFS